VDYWLCQIFTRSLGTILPSFRIPCVTRRRFSPPEGCMQRTCMRWQHRSWLVADHLLGNSVGAIESVACALGTIGASRAATWIASASPCLVKLAPFGGSACVLYVRGLRIVTWLILPVVICLSQRLSHACLSISNYTVKLRMAH
jgi:hypothetical protein